jgi:hypothetical protein
LQVFDSKPKVVLLFAVSYPSGLPVLNIAYVKICHGAVCISFLQGNALINDQ